MHRAYLAALLSALTVSCAGVLDREPSGDRAVRELIETACREHGLPAMAAAVVKGDRIVALEAYGIRHIDSAETVTREDRFHIGSCTKGMVATLAATFVEEGRISWDTRPADVFPELRDTIHPDYRTVTLRDLLTHRAGLPPVTSWDELRSAPPSDDPPVKRRRDYTVALLRQAPYVGPHEKFVYSNAGYAVAGAMIEATGGKPWRELMTERVFKPLGMRHSGFSWPVFVSIHQPWGHYRDDDAALADITVQKPDSSRVVPTVIESCGDVHATMEDLARFVRFHMRGYHGRDGILRSSTVRALHQPVDGYYASGWAVTDEIKGQTISRHAGSCGNFMALMAFSHDKRVGVVVAANVGGNAAETACNKVMAALMMKYSE